jgi:hypothetical protein
MKFREPALNAKSIITVMIFLVFAAAVLPSVFSSIAQIALGNNGSYNCTGVCGIFLTILPWAVMAGVVYAVLKHYDLV